MGTNKRPHTSMLAKVLETSRWLGCPPTSGPTSAYASSRCFSCCCWCLFSFTCSRSSAPLQKQQCLLWSRHLLQCPNPRSLTIARARGFGRSTKRDGVANTTVLGAQPLHLQRQRHQRHVRSPSHHAPSIAMLGTMSGRCSGSRVGPVPRKSTAARRCSEAALLSFHHPRAFHQAASLRHPIPDLTIAMPATIHASIV